MEPQAIHAIHAAKQRKYWSRQFTRGYLKIFNVPFGLYRLARQLEATQHIS